MCMFQKNDPILGLGVSRDHEEEIKHQDSIGSEKEADLTLQVCSWKDPRVNIINYPHMQYTAK